MLTAKKEFQSLSKTRFSKICTITGFYLLLLLKIYNEENIAKNEDRTKEMSSISIFSRKSEKSFRRCSKLILNIYSQLTDVMVLH